VAAPPRGRSPAVSGVRWNQKRATAARGTAGELPDQVPGRRSRLPGSVNLPEAGALPAVLRGKSARSRAVLITLSQIFTDTQEMAGKRYRWPWRLPGCGLAGGNRSNVNVLAGAGAAPEPGEFCDIGVT
jgi:hypothetical protein